MRSYFNMMLSSGWERRRECDYGMIHKKIKLVYQLILVSFGYGNIHYIISFLLWYIKNMYFNKKRDSGRTFRIKGTKQPTLR